ncbi:hypothetical protein KRE40_04415 [Elizabethkingia meningoseptica]|uniref:Uncharacterized protein n=1 Tax=Elizabethkingia meningoseptica TaxID=238 RepID=A0A1V3U596_ELIME|nr:MULTISPECIES: hypothetical protein [Elizabethkingia]AQX05153.1 hypothetical protein BBD33_07800 [Elizabethkingia meningoseptica]AQX12727.1 hypothetical protein BBD35_10250 [Elizabethkingia meningoseptica]AQX47198.1 hypothetical protein B5G46_07790 [Elizabethkingia meningoseptica]EJK5330476.1 hypothetical protein [Elizabethkingia meningoseptica]EOR29686.1 hypothetical protein L100_10139 [Elizabethkingia meningoseptica ATCC 13253 = NBRC 12535]
MMKNENQEKNHKEQYTPPLLEVILIEMEQGFAASSPVQPGGGSGVQEEDWTNGGIEVKDPDTNGGEWWK